MNYLESMKNIIKSKEKRVENIIFLIIILVVFLFAIGQIFKTDSNENKSQNIDNTLKDSNNTSSSLNINSSENLSNTNVITDIENKLSKILSEISGLSDVSVMITYSEATKTRPIYNITENETESKKTTEKSVVYNEEDGDKKIVVETLEMPKVEGILIVAKGKLDIDLKSKIAIAISNLTGVASHKVQIFEK